MTGGSSTQVRLIQFLRDELAIPAASIQMALKQNEPESNMLPMVLWQYGLITLDQLNRIFDWMETAA